MKRAIPSVLLIASALVLLARPAAPYSAKFMSLIPASNQVPGWVWDSTHNACDRGEFIGLYELSGPIDGGVGMYDIRDTTVIDPITHQKDTATHFLEACEIGFTNAALNSICLAVYEEKLAADPLAIWKNEGTGAEEKITGVGDSARIDTGTLFRETMVVLYRNYYIEMKIDLIMKDSTDSANGTYSHCHPCRQGAMALADTVISKIRGVAIEKAYAVAGTVQALALEAQPNPFNPVTTINFQISSASQIHLSIYNSAGNLVITLARGWMEPGKYTSPWNATGQSSGLYLVKLKAGNKVLTSRILLTK
jgi:hypothetical protein